MRLTKDQIDQIDRDLQSSPRVFGFAQSQWTGNCLSRHLAKQYQLVRDARQCRRLIQRRRRPAQVTLAAAPPQPPRTFTAFSDSYRQQKTLQRLRQLSMANLPLQPFAAALFDLIPSATNSGTAVQMLIIGDVHHNEVIPRDFETIDWTIANTWALERANLEDSSITGMLIPSAKLKHAPESVLPPGRFISSRFHESPSYDELWRHFKVSSGAMNILRTNGEFIGYLPVWKSKNEKPFMQDDLNFLHHAMPLVAHGVKVAQSRMSIPISPSDTQPRNSRIGVVTTDWKGDIVALDKVARSLFFQPALFDGRPLDAFSDSNLKSGLKYVASVIRQTFGQPGKSLALPAARVWWHRTGCMLMLRAVLSERVARTPLITVLVEEHEPSETRQRRLAIRYGMSPRESDVFHLAKAGKSRKEIAQQLDLSDNTIKTYLKQATLKVSDFDQAR